jgi:hypothetical protein
VERALTLWKKGVNPESSGEKKPNFTRHPWGKVLESHITHVSELKARHWQDIDSQLDSNFDVTHASDRDKATTMKDVINAASRRWVVLSSDEDE